MKLRWGCCVAPAIMLALGACASGQDATDATVPSPRAASDPSPTPAIQDVMELEGFVPLDPGTYFIDPDGDPSTPLRVVYEIPVEGWSQWIGAAKFADDDGHVGVSITTVENVVRQACHNHSPTDPPVGPTVDDLAAVLTDLAPFKVTSPPKNVTIYGYRGKHLELTVPDLPVSHEGFTECLDANLYSWMSPHLGTPGDNAFFGYTGPGYREEIRILDAEGTLLMIAAGRSPGSSSEDLAEQQAILDSIRIERPTPPPPSGGKLAYGLDGDIYVAESDGSDPVRIADGRSPSECGGNGEYWAVGPMWSPDGRYLAYRHQNCPLRSEEDPSGVVISDPEGNVVAELPAAEFGQNLSWRISWSPDSTRFATWVTAAEFAAPDGTRVLGDATIGVFELQGARHALLSVPPRLGAEFDPMWLPDGESLLVRDVVVPIDGRTPYHLPFGSPDHDVMYSPDGSRVAYVQQGDAYGVLFVAEADGSNPQAVLEGSITEHVVWSPAGDRIAFESSKAGTDHVNELRVVDLNTGTVTLLADWSDREAESYATLVALDFSPEGDRILFGVLEGKGSLWSVNVDGSDLRRLVTGTFWGDWLPPGPTP